MSEVHKPVLLSETISSLNLQPGQTIVDATFGSGGHAEEIVKKISPCGHYIGIDIDSQAFDGKEAKINKKNKVEVSLVNDNFSNISKILEELNVNSIDAAMADLGWRIEQFFSGGKGLSFLHDEPLLMTFGNPEKYSFTAEEIVNSWSESVLANIIFGYSEERYARRIAKEIVNSRKKQKITTTGELVEIIEKALPARAKNRKRHFATTTFQALRIAVNDEFSVLEKFINDVFLSIKPGGRLSIISFHSLEDRIVKNLFRNFVNNNQAMLLNRKPIIPSGDEIKNNPRSRSSKLRTIIKI